jgi:DNA-binding transcriptional ArsR family regulator
MQDIFVVRDLETLKALSDSRRLEILRQLLDPLTTRQVAESLGENPNNIYYHMNELEKHGLIEVVKTTLKGHLLEKHYQAVARFYTPAADLFESSFVEAKEVTYQLILKMFDSAAYELHKLVQDTNQDLLALDDVLPHQTQLRLTPEKIHLLRERLADLIKEFESQEQSDTAPGALLTVLLFPLAKDGLAADNIMQNERE